MGSLDRLWCKPEFKDFMIKKRAENPRKFKNLYDVQDEIMRLVKANDPKPKPKQKKSFWGKI